MKSLKEPQRRGTQTLTTQKKATPLPLHSATWVISLFALIGGLMMYLFLGVMIFSINRQATGGLSALRQWFLPMEASAIPWITATGFYCLTMLITVLLSITEADRQQSALVRQEQSGLAARLCSDLFQFSAMFLLTVSLLLPVGAWEGRQKRRRLAWDHIKRAKSIGWNVGQRVVGPTWGWVASLAHQLHRAKWHLTVALGLIFVAIDLGGFYTLAAFLRTLLYGRFFPGAQLNALTDLLNFLQSVPGGIFYVGRQSLYYLLVWQLTSERFSQLRVGFQEQATTQLASGLLHFLPGWFFRWLFPGLIWLAFAFHVISGLLIMSGAGAYPGDPWSSLTAFMVAWRQIFVGPMFAWLASIIQYRILVGSLKNSWERCQRIAFWAVFWGLASQLFSGPIGYLVRTYLMDHRLPALQLEAGYLWTREGLGNAGGVLVSVITLLILTSITRNKQPSR